MRAHVVAIATSLPAHGRCIQVVLYPTPNTKPTKHQTVGGLVMGAWRLYDIEHERTEKNMRELQELVSNTPNKQLFGVFDTDLLAVLSCAMSYKLQAPMGLVLDTERRGCSAHVPAVLLMLDGLRFCLFIWIFIEVLLK